MQIKRTHTLIVILIFIIIVLVAITKSNFENLVYISQQYISHDLLFWTFSTVVQSFVAFVSLLGMVVIYRTQIIQRNKENLAESMREYLVQYRGQGCRGYTTNKIIKDIKGLAENPNDDALTRADLEFSNLEKDENKIKKTAIFFFCSTIFLLIFSLVLLSVSPALEYTLSGLLFLWLIIFWSFVSFILGLNLLVGLI